MKRALVLATALLAGAGTARAADRSRALTHTTRPGDTPKKVAAVYYGAHPIGDRLLLAANGYAQGTRAFVAGRTLRIPTAWSYRIRPGDTFAQLATDYLGDKRYAFSLARLNYKRPNKAPPGHVIIIPAHVRMRARWRTSAYHLAADVLGKPRGSAVVRKLAKAVMRHNGLKSYRIRALSYVVIPVMDLRVRNWYLPSAPPGDDQATLRRSKKLLADARADLAKGRYIAAVAKLSRTGTRLPPKMRFEIQLRLCTAFVALAQRGPALQAAKGALKLQPAVKLDPVQISPKVRAVFQQARGK